MEREDVHILDTIIKILNRVHLRSSKKTGINKHSILEELKLKNRIDEADFDFYIDYLKHEGFIDTSESGYTSGSEGLHLTLKMRVILMKHKSFENYYVYKEISEGAKTFLLYAGGISAIILVIIECITTFCNEC